MPLSKKNDADEQFENQPEDTSDLLTVKELAHYLQLRPSTIYNWAQEGLIPGFKIGRLWYFRPAEVQRWLESHTDRPWD